MVKKRVSFIKLSCWHSSPYSPFQHHAIIPTRCINKLNNTLICDKVPSSGYYSEVDQPANSDKMIFRLRKEYRFVNDKKLAREIHFIFEQDKPVLKLAKELPEHAILLAPNIDNKLREINLQEPGLEAQAGSAKVYYLIMDPTELFVEEVARE